MIVLCGVGDGGGKVCGRPIQHFREIDPYGDADRRFIVGMCTKHAFVAVAKSRFHGAEAAGQRAVHLVREREVVTMLADVARRSPQT